MRGCGEEMAALEMDGDKIKDTKSLDALVDGTYKGTGFHHADARRKSRQSPANTGGAKTRGHLQEGR